MRYDGHFRLAHELKKSLNDVMGWDGPMTHRQFILWSTWLDEQFNVPSRDNYYQMQIACETRRLFSKNPRSIKTEQFKLNLERKIVSKKSSKKDKIEATKRRWFGGMTKEITVQNESGDTLETIIPGAIKRQQELKKQIQERRKQAQARQSKKPNKPIAGSSPEGKNDNGNSTGIGATTGKNDRGRQQVHKNVGRRKRKNTK